MSKPGPQDQQIAGKGQMIVKIAGGNDIGPWMWQFEWAAFINGGYIIRAEVADPGFVVIKDLATRGYLAEGRHQATPVTFKLKWHNGGETEERKAIMTSLKATGQNEGGNLEFIAIDPPNYFLNEGTAEGKFYEGKVSDVIKAVVKDYAEGSVEVEVSDTKDNPKNIWYMMRQDPKTFIRSLLDWSSSAIKKKDGKGSRWIVVSKDEKLIIKDQSDFPPEDLGIYHINRGGKTQGRDGNEYELLANNFITPVQTKLITSGISAISGEYLDKITDTQEMEVHIKDSNTGNKVNVDIGEKQGFTAPPDDKASGATSIMAIPEHSAGDLGIPYKDYIDGRARGQFTEMLNLGMRMRLRVDGESATMDDPTKLGVAKVTLTVKDVQEQDYFIGGRWLIYGFHHVMSRQGWDTDLYLARLDHDADASPKI